MIESVSEANLDVGSGENPCGDVRDYSGVSPATKGGGNDLLQERTMSQQYCTDCAVWVIIKNVRSWGAHIVTRAHRKVVDIRLGIIGPRGVNRLKKSASGRN